MATGKSNEAKAKCCLNCCKCNFFPKITVSSMPWDYSLIVDLLSLSPSGHYHKSCPHAISSEPVQFQNNCTISAYGFCIVVGNSHTIREYSDIQTAQILTG